MGQDQNKQQISILNETIRWIRSNCIRLFNDIPNRGLFIGYDEENHIEYTVSDRETNFMVDARPDRSSPIMEIFDGFDYREISTKESIQLEESSLENNKLFYSFASIIIDRTERFERKYYSYEEFANAVLDKIAHPRLNSDFEIKVISDRASGSVYVNPFNYLRKWIVNPVLMRYFDFVVDIPEDALTEKKLIIQITESETSGPQYCRILEIFKYETTLI